MTHSWLTSTLGILVRSRYSGSGALHVSGGDVLYSQTSLARALLSRASLLVCSLCRSCSWKTNTCQSSADKLKAYCWFMGSSSL